MTEKPKKKQLIIESPSNSLSSEKQELSSNKSNSSSSSLDSDNSSLDSDSKLSKDELESEFKKIDCNDEKFYSNDCNKFLLKKELIERENISEHTEDTPYLYPNLNET